MIGSRKHWIAAAVSIFSVLAALAIGQLATFPNLAPWYAALAKPAFNPPNWIFGPVWSLLYALMAFSLWRLLTRESGGVARPMAIAAFYTQLVLNALWSVVFFGAHSPLFGLVDIVPQWIAIMVTIFLAARIDQWAAAALVPLAAWVAFAGLLNFEIWRLNG